MQVGEGVVHVERGEEGACGGWGACVCVRGEGAYVYVWGGGRGSLRCKSIGVAFQS